MISNSLIAIIPQLKLKLNIVFDKVIRCLVT